MGGQTDQKDDPVIPAGKGRMIRIDAVALAFLKKVQNLIGYIFPLPVGAGKNR